MSRHRSHDGTAAEVNPPLGAGASADLVVELPRVPAHKGATVDLVRYVAQHLPSPDSLAAGAWLAATLEPAPRKRLFGGKRNTDVLDRLARAACCTALAALGYEQICVDESGTAFGRVSSARRSA
jgi:hypothetical protein